MNSQVTSRQTSTGTPVPTLPSAAAAATVAADEKVTGKASTPHLDINLASPPQAGVSGTTGQEIVLIHPRKIRAGKLPNRVGSSFESDKFNELYQSIMNTRGNVEPISVRRIPVDANGCEFELIFGACRTQACLKAQLDVRAIIEAPDDKLGDLATLHENLGRQDLSPFELGRQIKFILESKQVKSLRSLAVQIGRDAGDLSKAVSIANLPPEIISAFKSPLDVQYRFAKQLTDAITHAREAVLQAALEIQGLDIDSPERESKKVFQQLIDAAKPKGVGPSNTPVEQTLYVGGKSIGRMSVDRTGRIQITLDEVLNTAQKKALAEKICGFIGRELNKRDRLDSKASSKDTPPATVSATAKARANAAANTTANATGVEAA